MISKHNTTSYVPSFSLDFSVTLIGMPGAGKTTTGELCADVLHANYIDTDILLENYIGTSLQDYLDHHTIRDMLSAEETVLCNYTPTQPTFIATGGSAVYSQAAMEHFERLGPLVYLKVSFEELQNRLGDFSNRGVIMRNASSQTLFDLYQERTPLYERFATITVDLSNANVEEAVECIISEVSFYKRVIP